MCGSVCVDIFSTMGKTEIKGFKDIPQVEKVLAEKELGKYIEKYSRPLVTRYVRRNIETLRDSLKAGKTSSTGELLKAIPGI